MADLDTRDKRASAIGIGLPWMRIYPNPDGDITSQADRQHMAFVYRAIAAAAGAATSVARFLANERLLNLRHDPSGRWRH